MPCRLIGWAGKLPYPIRQLRGDNPAAWHGAAGAI